MRNDRKRHGVVLAAVAVMALAACSGDRAGRLGSDGFGSGPVTLPDIPQAPWKVSAHPAGNLGKITKKQARRINVQGKAVRRLITEVYLALFLDPDRRDEVFRRRFLTRAARALPPRAGTPNGATRVRTTLRKADIGIDAATARRAAAEVTVRARGAAGDKRFALLHKATLWLERSRGRWKVIAFDLVQRPLR